MRGPADETGRSARLSPAGDGRALARRLVAALVGLLLLGWGLGELARAAARATDLTAVRDQAALRTRALTSIAHALSLLGSGYVIFPLTLACVVLLCAVGRRAGAAVAGLSLIGAVVIANIDKVLVGRPRPPVHHLELVSSASFPSGHASQSTALALALLLVFLAIRPARLWAALSACATVLVLAAIAWSRVYLGVHYPTDVAGGILLAGAWTLTVAASLLPVSRHRPAGACPDATRVTRASPPGRAPASGGQGEEPPP